MSRLARATMVAIAVAATAGFSFWLGKRAGRLQESLARQATYAWDLHRKIGTADLSCLRLTPREFGRFTVQSLDEGQSILVAYHDQSSGRATAFVIDTSGRFATESWPLDCKP